MRAAAAMSAGSVLGWLLREGCQAMTERVRPTEEAMPSPSASMVSLALMAL